MARWQRALYQPAIGLGADGQRITGCEKHRILSKEAAREGMVLLKNESGLLPFAEGSRVALFGKGTFDYVKGGGGSGDVTVAYITNLYEGMKKTGKVSICEELADFYRENVKKQYAEKKEPGLTTEPEVPEELYRKARAYTDTAVISICRFSGEGWDRKDVDFYLTEEEKKLVENVKKRFPKVAVVLNVGGMVDTSWFRDDAGISSALLAWQGGMEGGLAAAELLCGICSPSGKLSDTFAVNFEAYPSSANFHESDAYVEYTDDIYVGYRYFETIPEAAEKVNYEFGYGLSYTEFEWTKPEITCLGNAAAGDPIVAVTTVTNVGSCEGKEVLQLYGSAPDGMLGKPKKQLLAFEKTRLLKPGESQKVSFTFSLKDIASYDDIGKIEKSAYLLEAGTYQFYFGNSVRHVEKMDPVVELPETRIVEKLSAKLVPSALHKRLRSDGSYEDMPCFDAGDLRAYELDEMAKEPLDGLLPSGHEVHDIYAWGRLYKKDIRPFSEVAEGTMTMDEFLAQLTDEELADLLGGQPNTGVANTWGFGNLPEYGVPNIMTADGPAGLRIQPQCGICTTAWPCATLLACTWNPEIVREVGAAGAAEVKENNIAVWLTPAINIHRSPLCGRNFEYYSEDPYLTGVIGSAMVEGIQSQNIAATVKHFALNNKETDRKHSDSRVSERAAREIYLRGFEYIVKKAKPWCVMSSYNIINGYQASECADLLTGILRDEWGFDGVVTSDWWTLGEHYKEVKAGNDVKMACGYKDRLLEAKEKGLLTREEMERSAARILSLILKIE